MQANARTLLIILCGAGSIGKFTLAQEWSKKHVKYTRIEEVTRNIVKSSNLPRDDLGFNPNGLESVPGQLQIMEEQNRHESEVTERTFISVM